GGGAVPPALQAGERQGSRTRHRGRPLLAASDAASVRALRANATIRCCAPSWRFVDVDGHERPLGRTEKGNEGSGRLKRIDEHPPVARSDFDSSPGQAPECEGEGHVL